VDASPARLQQVEDRLAELERLKRKYGPALQDVIDKGEALARERELLGGGSDRAEDLQKALAAASETFLASARDLSKRRKGAALIFAKQLETLLAELAMARTRFEVRFNDTELGPEGWNERGIDQAEFYISPNVGEAPRPLTKIVSGGELSRVMLALKTIAAGPAPGTGSARSPIRRPASAPTKTLIFDEVDAGIGGRVADVVGARLRALGDGFQVLCITHLPQIAARATTQFLIEKQVKGSRTVTRVDRLDETARVEEIGRMLGGAHVSESVRATARDLIAAATPETRGGSPTRPQQMEAQAKGKQKAKGESESQRRG
jgi:DNA repair protein RecN (Recombination protein N)